MKNTRIVWFSQISKNDVGIVGGKNASLGEMLTHLKKKGIKIPNGFATTANAYWEFLEFNNLKERIEKKIHLYQKGELSLSKAGETIRGMIRLGKMPPLLLQGLSDAYQKLCRQYRAKNVDVAVRSSATAEDLPDASFAGQQETFLNIRGVKDLEKACKKCFASLFTNRAIAYRETKNFSQTLIALSIGIQKMVHSDKGASGVMFTIDTETGFPKIILINAIWGLGELIVQGKIEPDEYMVYKPLLDNKSFCPIIEKDLGTKIKKMVYSQSRDQSCKILPTTQKERNQLVLSDAQILKLARWGALVEKHYGKPMDLEWALDGITKELYIVQARPETVHSQKAKTSITTFHMQKKGKKIVSGLSVGKSAAFGKARLLQTPAKAQDFQEGDILVTKITDPDWVPIMKKASAIITDHGGRTSHAAIVSRELGLPAIVGTENATHVLKNGQEITVSCVEGDQGFVYEGKILYDKKETPLKDIPKTNTHIMLNMADPAAAMIWWQLPSDGVGLARMEFVINNHIQIHPMALVHFAQLKSNKAKKQIEKLTATYKNKEQYFIDRLAYGLSKIASVHHPKPVIVRLSDFKTNEYARLIGGEQFEPKEENPMLGWRGASRYYHPHYQEGFALECLALKKAREEIGMTNIKIMIPFCRTLEEADKVLAIMKKYGLARGRKGLEVYVMCEIPSNVVLAEEFAKRFDGFSIGSNDLTQLILGVDRDSGLIAPLFREDNTAVTAMISEVIKKAHKMKRHVGICGQAPSDHPQFARFLVEAGIDAISVIPDSFLAVKTIVKKAESAS